MLLYLPYSFHPPAHSASPVSVLSPRLPQSWTLIWLWISASFAISRQNVISANLTTSQIDNSTGYVITLEVSNLISQCIVVSEELEVMVRGEEKEKFPSKQLQSSLLIWSETLSYKEVTYKSFCLELQRNPIWNVCITMSILKMKKWWYGYDSQIHKFRKYMGRCLEAGLGGGEVGCGASVL